MFKVTFVLLFAIQINFFFISCETSWKSLSDCLSNFPRFEHNPIVPAFDSVPALKHEFPHAAAIGWSQLDSKDITWSCGGSLISEDTVMTAAHCTWNFQNEEPDVVRLGDLNLITDDDEKDAQQHEIQSIIRHPEYKPRYNDIALIKLKTKVNVTEFVIPACLWSRHGLPYDVKLEACGYGQTEFLGDISAVLSKIVVTSIGRDECQEFYEDDRKLKHGLSDRIHLCADDKMGLMDSCNGDSGGPLEMKLEYEFASVPFIVGITAFGKGCGFDTPGVYTRVSNYVNWIKEYVPEVESNAKKCAKINQEFRVFDEKYVFEGFAPQKEIHGQIPNQKTLGVIITDRFLLGLASELKKLNTPQTVQLGEPAEIEGIYFHPKYVQGCILNNIALVKLKKGIRWFQRNHPTCVSNSFYDGSFEFPEILFQEELYIDVGRRNHQEVQVTSLDDCYNSLKFNPGIGPTDSLFCLKNDHYHIPQSCDVAVGSPVFLKGFSDVRDQTLVQGLVLATRDCTFTLALNVTKYYDWIESVVFTGSETGN